MLQQIDLVIVRLHNMGNKNIKEAIKALYAIKGVSRAEVLATVMEYCDHLDSDKAAAEKSELLRFVKAM